jgi:CubicO group peptidase (beta-lactamase class C family)
MKLVEEGKLSLSDKVFGSGSILGTAYGTTPYKSGITSITVQHLLEHTAGGWDNDGGDGSSDPMFTNSSLSQDKLISWVLDNMPLDNTPGDKYEYSNFGYCVLGRIIEKKTGQSYANYVKTQILTKAGISDMHIAGDTKDDKRRNEVVYYGQNNENPYGMKVARMDAHGGWIASAIDLARLLIRVDGFSTKTDLLKSTTIDTMTTPCAVNAGYAKGWSVNSANNWWHGGSLPGTQAVMVRASNGFCWAILVNTRSKKDGFFNKLDGVAWTILNGVKTWASYDLF